MKADNEIKDMVQSVTRILTKIGHPIPSWFTDEEKIRNNDPLTDSDKAEMLDALIASYRAIYAESFSNECAREFGHHEGEPVFLLNGHGLCASVTVVAAFLQFQIESVIFSESGSTEDVYRFYASNASSDQPEFIVNTIRAGFSEIAGQIASGDTLIMPVMH